MEVKYNIRYLMEDDEFDFIELKLSLNSLNKEEIQVLKENRIAHKYLENNEIILIIKSLIPKDCRNLIFLSKRVMLFTLARAFGCLSVKGFSLVPFPAANIKAFIILFYSKRL